jgi:hypothetical protein
MKRIKDYFVLLLIFACAVILTMALVNAASVDAKGLPQTLFASLPDRPGEGGSDKGPPSPASRGKVIPGRGGEDESVRDPETPGFTAFFPKGSVSEPIQVKFFNTGLPVGVPPLPNSTGPPFCFGAWTGEGVTVRQFDRSIVVNVNYDDSGLASHQKERLRIYVYNPAIKAWIKLGGRVDIYKNVVTGFLASPLPLGEGGNTLFAVAVDETPPLEQVVDEFGKTTLSVRNRGFRFHVLPGTVRVGAYFEVTPLADIPDTNSFKLINSVAINAYEDDSLITDFPKPVSVEFDYDADALAEAGGQANLTIVTLQNGEWIGVRELGYKVDWDGNRATVEADKPGVFSLAIKRMPGNDFSLAEHTFTSPVNPVTELEE